MKVGERQRSEPEVREEAENGSQLECGVRLGNWDSGAECAVSAVRENSARIGDGGPDLLLRKQVLLCSTARAFG